MTAAPAPIDVLLTRTQQRVLSLLFAQDGERSISELVRRSGGGSGAIRREVERMAAAGLLRSRRVGNQRLFSAEPSSPFYADLKSLGVKTVAGVRADAIRRRPSAALLAGRGALLKLLARHRLANPRVFGSVARGADTETSDLDILVDAPRGTSLMDMAGAAQALEDALGVPVDLVTLQDLPTAWRSAALAESVPL